MAASGRAGEAGPASSGRHRERRLRRIALIAHDNKKADLLEWAHFNRGTLSRHELYATGTTGTLIARELDLPVTRFLSGPLGGDQQVGAAIAEGRIDFVVFFYHRLSISILFVFGRCFSIHIFIDESLAVHFCIFKRVREVRIKLRLLCILIFQ